MFAPEGSVRVWPCTEPTDMRKSFDGLYAMVKKAFTLQTLPPVAEEFPEDRALSKAGGFSLHAGTVAGADERSKLERLCRYISRPALAEKRLSLTPGSNVRYHFKTPWRDGTTPVVFEPMDFIARLAALVRKPRVNLTRFHGVFATNSRYRAFMPFGYA